MNAKYYVLARTLWQGDEWSAVAGSFDSLEKAQEVAMEKEHDGWSESVWSEQHQAYWAPTHNLKNVVNTRVVNTTTMRKEYGISKDQALEDIYRIDMIEAEMAERAKAQEMRHEMEACTN